MTHSFTFARLAPAILGLTTLLALGLSSPSAHAQSYTESTVYSFTGTGGDGYYPYASLTDVNVGGTDTLYGTTEYGGSSDLGTVFSIDTAGHENTLYGFTGIGGDGAFPVSNLIDVGGTLYGTTSHGGNNSNGTVFSIDTAGHENTLYSFSRTGSDGITPVASLIDVGGTLYGTTEYGGSSGEGTVFSIDSSGHETTLFSFNYADGAEPVAGLTDIGGTLYGTTPFGGTNNYGTVFSIDTSGHENTLYSFTGTGGDGVFPSASLIDVGGTLYGTTEYGGSSGQGTVFSIDTSGNEHTVFSFSGTNGADPNASLIDVGGTLYGTTAEGGTSNYGTVFSINADGTNENTLYSFTDTGGDGAGPVANLIDVGGTLYGTTPFGSNNSNGTVFSLTPNSVATPEPASWASFLFGGLGLLGLTVKARRRTRTS